MSQSLSIIIPVLNEAEALPSLLESLQPLRAAGVEVIVSDGGSSDDSRAIADPLTDLILEGAIGRSAQMNAAAKVARGDWLLFLHADSVLPAISAQTVYSELGWLPSAVGMVSSPYRRTSPGSLVDRLANEPSIEMDVNCNG
jgi:glycosyltransferase involved in cell wall biosynthesis